MICDRSDKAIKPINIFQFVDMLLNWKFIETVVSLSKNFEKPKDYVQIGIDAEDYYRIKESYE